MTDKPSRAARKRTVLIVEDSETLALGLRTSFEYDGYDVHWVADGESALEWLTTRSPDLVILDLMLPKLNGFEVLRRFRASGGASSVLILSARDAEVDKVQGFRSGADDYVVKPVGVLELLARAEAMLRRTERRADPVAAIEDDTATLRFADVIVDLKTRTISRAGSQIELTPREYDLLVFLVKADGAIISREHVMHEVWHYVPGVTSRTVDQHIARLRHKIENDAAEPRYIITARKAGYRFAR